MKDFKVGWAIAEYYKNGKFKCFHEPSYNENYELRGVTGWGKLYYSKKSCKDDVDILNKLWNWDLFKCVKVKMEIIKIEEKERWI